MNHPSRTEVPACLVLRATTAADLMQLNPVSLRGDATVTDAVAFLTNRGCSAAPVIDPAGHPVGVLSRTDILIYDRERAGRTGVSEAAAEDPTTPPEPDRVRDLMTPVVFSVAAKVPAARAVAEMVALNVHQLYVVDDDGVLVGVINALDVLRHLQEEEEA